MRIPTIPRRAVGLLTLALLTPLGACGTLPTGSRNSVACLARVMYFESVRSSDEGMLAVGTVVMNRVKSRKFPNTVCGVVGQPNQFAEGALTRPMKEGRSRERALRVANAVLRGKRYRAVGNAMYFHTAGRTYPYSNMHYVAVAGGNAFYTRNPQAGRSYIPRRQIAMAGPRTSIQAPRGFFTATKQPGYQLASYQPPRKPTPKPVPPAAPAEPTIEELILASNGW